jgi:hypothetical protein
MNIDGVVRQLPLYQPPIDPALLVKAAAAGVDIATAVSDLAAPLPHYRFTYILQKAMALCGEVRSLGSLLLSALEKKDVEALALLRADHEVSLLKSNEAVLQLAIDEAEASIKTLREGKKLVEIRQAYFASRDFMNVGETLDLELRGYGWYLRTVAQAATAALTPLEAIPNVSVGVAGIASPVTLTRLPDPGEIAKPGVQVLNVLADLSQTAAGISQTLGGYERRQDEWAHQLQLAEQELEQFDRQLIAAEIRLAMAERELTNHEKQTERSEEARVFLQDKFTNEQLYSWMVTQLSTTYFSTYQLAYDMAKRAERCYRHELGIEDTALIQFGYWDSLKKGLMSGETLQLDLHRLESAYLENNHRELELSKTVSLATLNPEALIRLTQTGECYVSLPEALFDLDYPGHYFRRIKSLSVTIPAVAGPYTTVSCTLTLLSDRVRKVTQTGTDESLFQWNVGSVQSIATSRAQADSGVFQLDFRDERYLPFERAGTISSWKLQLSNPELAQFDLSTVSDVLIHVNYIARDGGMDFRTTVESELVDQLNSLLSEDSGVTQAISLKDQYPDAWARMMNSDALAPHTMDLAIGAEHFAYFLRHRIDDIRSIQMIALPDDGTTLNLDSASVELKSAGAPTAEFLIDPVLQVPSTMLSESDVSLGDHELVLNEELLAQKNDIKDLMMICTVDVG